MVETGMEDADVCTDAKHPDWGHLPSAALQTLGRHCCPASKAKLRLVCRTWHNALAAKFRDIYIGPGSPWPVLEDEDLADDAATDQRVTAVQRCYPAATTLHVTVSSTRDYPASYTQDLAQLLCGLPGLANLSLQELHELEDFDNLDLASLWDALEAAAPSLGQRLVGLNVSDCFWNDPELFGVLRHLTALTQLRLANNPLEAADEVSIIASMPQLRVLEFGLIYDGASQHHDVPRALEAVGNLQQLEELSLPMWRRSLGGRAHPLAPALSAALGRLTQLTSLAVDGKFGHLKVVSSLTNLQRLASAAPMSVEGWEAISKLPQLTLLTSLTPPSEPLRLNPARPHPGLDLALLATRDSLVGLDVGVMQPEHLATIGQFTRLERLNLRCADTFQQPQQQAQLLTAISCLPGSITSLHLGPLLPLSCKLLHTIACSCPGLKALHASFAHIAAATAAAALGLQGQANACAAVASGVLTSVASKGSDSLAELDAEMEDADPKGASEIAGMRIEGTPGSAVGPSVQALSTRGVSRALRKLRRLQRLELTLLGRDEHNEGEHVHSAWHGSSAEARAGSADASAAVAVPAGFALPCVQLSLEDLPPNLEQLALTGPWHLCVSSSRAAGAQQPTGLLSTLLSSHTSGPAKLPSQQCLVCGGAAAAKAAAAAGHPAALPVQQLCECTWGMKLASPSSSGLNILKPDQHGAAVASHAQQQQQQQAGGSAGGSPARTGRPTSGHKRPGLHSALLAAAAGNSSAANSSGMDSGDDGAAAGSGGGDVFVLEHARGLEKRTRSFSGPVAEQEAVVQGAVEQMVIDVSQNGQQATVLQPPEQLPLPMLTDLCLFGCHISFEALAQLVATAGVKLNKLQLLQVHTNTSAAVRNSNTSSQRPEQPLAIIAEGVVMHPAAAVQQRWESSSQDSSGRVVAWQKPAEITTQQLMALPVAWECLQEWHLHPHQLWGLVRAGCFAEARSAAGARSSAADSAEDSSSSSSSNCIQQRRLPEQQRQQHAGGSALQHASRLMNLRHLHVVNRPAAFGVADPSVKERREGEALTCLPLHDRHAMQLLLHQLQAGLQQLPALRQLLLYMGHVVKEQPESPDVCADVWTEAGERLLEVMPACKVKHYKPTVVGEADVAGLAAVVLQIPTGAAGVTAAVDFVDYVI